METNNLTTDQSPTQINEPCSIGESNVLTTKVSYFSDFYDNEPIDRQLSDMVIAMKSEAIKKITKEIRDLKAKANNPSTSIMEATMAKKQADYLKKKLPSFMTNVLCVDGKTRKHIKKFLPTVGFDVDHLTDDEVNEIMSKLKRDPYVVIAQPSCSGKGIHFILLTDADEWLNAKWDQRDTTPFNFVYQSAKEYAELLIEGKVDEKCMNPERIFGICGDDNVYVNEHPKALHIDTSSFVEPNTKQSASSNTSMPGNYHANINDVSETIIRHIEDRGIHFAPGSRNDFVLRFALAANKYGVSQSETESFCTSRFAESDFKDSEILATIRSAYNKNSEHGTYSATPANMPNAKSSENIGKSTISSVSDMRMADGGMADMAETSACEGTGYTFSDKLKSENLVALTKAIYDMHIKEPAKCDAQLIGALNVIGGMMGGANGTPELRSGIYGIYDGRRVYAPTYNIVYSGAGNDKGNLIFCKYLLHAVKSEMRSKYEEEKKDFDTEMAEWENKSKKDRGAAPKEPTYKDPYVPGNSSSSAVYRAMAANGGWGLMFETEADTISSMIDSDYGNYSDLMRKAHHHESLTMNRVTEKVHIDIDEPRLSIFLTCTPGQLPALFPSFENGLGSRFLFYHTPDENVEFHNVFALKETPLEDVYKKLGNDLLPLYHAMQMRADHPIQFVMSQRQQKEFLDTYSGVLQEQFKMLGKGIRAFVFRIALDCFRYGMILTTLRRLSDWQKKFDPSNPEQPSIFLEEENALTCDDRDFDTAMLITGCLINHTARVYSILAKEEDNPFAQKGIKLTADDLKVYNALTEGDFHTSDFIEVAAGFSIPERTAQRMLSQMCNVYRIINPVRRGIYNKPARKEMLHE